MMLMMSLKFLLSLTGFLKDYTKKYDLAFAIGGAMIIIAAFFHFAIGCVKSNHEEEEVEGEIGGKNKTEV